jgi:hypothetical protein
MIAAAIPANLIRSCRVSRKRPDLRKPSVGAVNVISSPLEWWGGDSSDPAAEGLNGTLFANATYSQ